MLVGEAFRLKGYQIEETGGGGADGGIDLVLRMGGKRFLVQCKQWRSYKVGVGVIREHFGVMTAERADGGFVVTSGRFTAEARAFAKDVHVELIEGESLFKMIKLALPARGLSDLRGQSERPPQPTGERNPLEGAPVTRQPALAPVCPRCSSEMIRRTAKRGANAGSFFWGCSNYPNCRGTA